jgi:hypothetical protein
MNKPSLTIRTGKEKLHGNKPQPITPRPQAPHSESGKQCDHKYQVLENNTETMYADSETYMVNVSTVFYCEKCLDIKHIGRSIRGNET